MGKRKKEKPKSHKVEVVDTVLAVPWYTPEQYERLLEAADDRDNLEDTYEEWKATADKTLKEMEKPGVWHLKIDVDVDELVSWCKFKNRPIDGAARTIFVADRVEEKIGRKK